MIAWWSAPAADEEYGGEGDVGAEEAPLEAEGEAAAPEEGEATGAAAEPEAG